MKRFLTAAFAGVLIMSALTGCGADSADENSIQVEVDTASNDESEETPQENTSDIYDSDSDGDSDSDSDDSDSVQINFSTFALGVSNEENIKKQAAAMGATATINDDSSIVLTISRENQKKRMDEAKKDLTDTCSQLSGEGSNYPFIKEISLNDDLTEITIKVDKAEYEAQTDISFQPLARTGLAYQCFNEAKLDDLQVVVHIVDNSNDTEFKTETYNKDGFVS